MVRKTWVIAAALAVVAAGAFSGCAGPGAGAAAPAATSTHVAQVKVPDVNGMSRSRAREVLQNRGFAAVDANVPESQEAPVIGQAPAAGTKMLPGGVVALTFEATSVATPTPTPTPAASALLQQIQQKFPGYPLVVPTSSVDYRVANWAKTTPQLVALAPGVYTAYNPAVTDLNFYVDQGNTAEGDCTLIKAMFSDRGGACWDGVAAGSAEPH